MIRWRSIGVVVLSSALFFTTQFVVHASADLMGHWKFDEGSGSTALDSSGNSRHGTLVGDATYTVQTPPSISFPDPYSLSLDGTGDGVTTPLSLNNLAEFTLAGWAYPRSAQASEGWFGANDVFEFFFGSSTSLNCWTGINAFVSWSFAGDPGFLNNWHHITCLGTGSSVILYVDGEEVARQNHEPTNNYGSGDNFSIGIGVQNGGTDGPFDGYIDDVRVYSRALTPQEMEGLGTGESGPTNAPSIETLSPEDNDTSVSLSADLSVTFSTSTIATSTGSIGIYTASDDTLVEEFSVSSSRISKSGATYTIDPTADFEESTEYYVFIPDTAFKDGSDTFFEGTASTTWSFTTGDFTTPEITSLTASTSATMADIDWTTDEQTSTRVVYGVAMPSTYTAITNTSPRVTTHQVTLTSLLACTTYQYVVVSADAADNTATSSVATFRTTGCEYDDEPTASETGTVSDGSTATTTIATAGKSFSVAATATSTSFVIQINAVSSENILNTYGRPGSSPEEVGSTVFDVKAIINGTTILDSFDVPVTITYEYTDEEIAGLVESTLRLYHYHDDTWEGLEECSIDQVANTISCTTDSFSIFGLFGTLQPSQSSSGRSRSGGVRFGCKDPAAINYEQFSSSKPELCQYAAVLPVRDLHAPMTGADVMALQKLLNANGYVLTNAGAGAPGSETEFFGALTQRAVVRFQSEHGVVPSVGYVGPLTRAKMQELQLSGRWW